MSATLLGLLALAALTTMLGRLASRVSRVAWLDRTHPDAVPLHAALGTALLTCFCATASHAGLGQRQAIPWVAASCAALALGAWRVPARAPRRAPLPAAPLAAWWPLLVASGVAAAIGLLPVLWFGSFSTFNDAFAYDAAADWLAGHGVADVAPRDPMLPALGIVAETQEAGLRLGSTYLQAFLAACFGRPHSLSVFYAVSCWGFLLLCGGVFCLGRRAFRLEPWLCTAAVCTLVCIPAGNVQALQTGFQAQMHGLAALLALLCTTARPAHGRPWAPGHCVVLGALLAWQTSAYSELLPLAGFVVLVWLSLTARRAARVRRWGAWIRGAMLLGASFALLGPLEIARAWAAIPTQLRAVVGWHVVASGAKWLGLFAGTAVYPTLPGLDRVVSPWLLLAPSLLVLALCLAGLWPRPARSLGQTTRAAALVLVFLVGHFALIAADPWSGRPPHTWSLYKLSQWLHPLVVVGAWAGAARVLHGPRARRAAGLALLMVGVGLPIQRRFAEVNSFRQMCAFTGSDRPLAQLEQLSEDMTALAGQQLCVVTRPQLTDPRFVELVGYFTFSLRGAGLPPGGASTLLCHRPRFAIAGARKLACDVVAVPVRDEPILCQVADADGPERAAEGQPRLRIGAAPATLVVFAPHAGRMRLSFASAPGPAPSPAACDLVVSSGGASGRVTIDAGNGEGFRTVSLHVGLAAGVNEITLTCAGGPGPALFPAGEPPGTLSFSRPLLAFE